MTFYFHLNIYIPSAALVFFYCFSFPIKESHLYTVAITIRFTLKFNSKTCADNKYYSHHLTN